MFLLVEIGKTGIHTVFAGFGTFLTMAMCMFATFFGANATNFSAIHDQVVDIFETA